MTHCGKDFRWPTGRSAAHVHHAGRWSKIRRGSYSAGKARRIPPQLIQKVEQALLDSVPVGWPAIRKVWSAVSVDDKSANALIELHNKLNTSAFASELRTNPKLKSEGN